MGFLADPTKYAMRLNEEEYCNMCITLINQATYMLKRLLERQQQQFLHQGGIKEQMYRARVNYRNTMNGYGVSDVSEMSDKSGK